MEISRDRRLIIPNVMNELCEKHDALLPNQEHIFDVMIFYHVGAYLKDPTIKETGGITKDKTVLKELKMYADKKKFITLDGHIIALTEKGIKECKKENNREWENQDNLKY